MSRLRPIPAWHGSAFQYRNQLKVSKIGISNNQQGMSNFQVRNSQMHPICLISSSFFGWILEIPLNKRYINYFGEPHTRARLAAWRDFARHDRMICFGAVNWWIDSSAQWAQPRALPFSPNRQLLPPRHFERSVAASRNPRLRQPPPVYRTPDHPSAPSPPHHISQNDNLYD